MINQAEISRVLDIAMNPDSLFLSERERRISTASVIDKHSLERLMMLLGASFECRTRHEACRTIFSRCWYI